MNKTALITGASAGIGLELAHCFARDGHNLVITARRRQRLEKLKKRLENCYPVTVHIIDLDLATPDSPEKLFSFCSSRSIRIDFLVNNAGLGDYGLFHNRDWHKTSEMINLNVNSLTHLTHLFLPKMVERREGKIMNVASTAAFQPGPLMSVYYATKHYVLAFSEALADELKSSGVTVTALCPGPTESEFQESANMQKSKLMDRLPMPSSETVARYGYRAMMKGKRIAVHGIVNKVLSKIVSFLPRRWVTASVRKVQERR